MYGKRKQQHNWIFKTLKRREHIIYKNSPSKWKIKTLSSVPGTYNYNASRVFNALPTTVRSCRDRNQFNRSCKAHFASMAANRV